MRHCCGSILWAALPAAAESVPALEPIDSQAAYPEGPLWRNGQLLLYVEYAGPGIKLWDGRKCSVLLGQPALRSLGPHRVSADDHLLVACYDSQRARRVRCARQNFRASSTKTASGKPFIGPNDFAADSAGGIYFSASGVYDLKAPITGAVLYMSPDGARVVELANTIHYSNGLTVSKDGKNLLVAEGLAGSSPLASRSTPTAPWGRVRSGRGFAISRLPRRMKTPITVRMA